MVLTVWFCRASTQKCGWQTCLLRAKRRARYSASLKSGESVRPCYSSECRQDSGVLDETSEFWEDVACGGRRRVVRAAGQGRGNFTTRTANAAQESQDARERRLPRDAGTEFISKENLNYNLRYGVTHINPDPVLIASASGPPKVVAKADGVTLSRLKVLRRARSILTH